MDGKILKILNIDRSNRDVSLGQTPHPQGDGVLRTINKTYLLLTVRSSTYLD
jgi:hypothetical protein